MIKTLLLLTAGMLSFSVARSQGQFYWVRQDMIWKKKPAVSEWSLVERPIEVRVFEKNIWILDHTTNKTVFCYLDSLVCESATREFRTKEWRGRFMKKKARVEIVFIEAGIGELLHYNAQLNIVTRKSAVSYRLSDIVKL